MCLKISYIPKLPWKMGTTYSNEYTCKEGRVKIETANCADFTLLNAEADISDKNAEFQRTILTEIQCAQDP